MTVTCYELEGRRPEVDDSAYIAPQATVIGQATLKANASVWPGAVLRADNASITIGERSNVQDGAVLHVDPGFPLLVGDDVTIGHQAMVHGCTVEDGCLIGIHATILNGAVIGRESLVGAGALVTEGKVFPPRSLIVGAPARAIRTLSDDDVARMRKGVDSYVQRAKAYRAHLKAV
ncbi:carbonic anhydrase/acetyltransferase-like protein (isoleucine patch superfamily) [Paracandidimonas soli]|jgi:carbonic anhydrase/acetyltransferase-like protein (isoleucine patch superfamily)|uniref:Carbonic anhydrase/acetyltransferase-like protein (Isoleucine patch superfamily) n=1 Tax=Paracandidimonas soli TaxID=1917182 RepID=A0A4R3UNT2_9BURK|nr:carbonic anhydrase/acetyltransferase-like protein (isoleucine patch superfamily) [Paracandidimonas soli]